MTTDNILAPVAALTLPDQALLIGGAQRMLSFIDSYAIESNDDFSLAADELKTIKSKQKTLEDQRTSITGPLNAATKAVNDLFRGPAELLTRAEGALKAKMLTWQRKVEAEAAEARRVAEEAARAQREAAEAEARKLAEVAQAQAAEAAKAQEAGNAQAAAIAEAAAQRARDEASAAASAAQMAIAAPVAQIAAPKAKGISTSSRLDFEVVSLIELVQHVAKHPELVGLLQVDSVRLRAYVKGVGEACALPGVRVTSQTSMSARAA